MLKFPDHFRYKNYGVAGNIRHKSYGVEYRTPSNAWIFDVDSHLYIFNTAQEVLDKLDELVVDEEDTTLVPQAINENSTEIAEYLIEKHRIAA
jgi:hypothetical protein